MAKTASSQEEDPSSTAAQKLLHPVTYGLAANDVGVLFHQRTNILQGALNGHHPGTQGAVETLQQRRRAVRCEGFDWCIALRALAAVVLQHVEAFFSCGEIHEPSAVVEEEAVGVAAVAIQAHHTGLDVDEPPTLGDEATMVQSLAAAVLPLSGEDARRSTPWRCRVSQGCVTRTR
jgi:hypothetical protein